MLSPTTILSGVRLTVGWEHESKAGTRNRRDARQQRIAQAVSGHQDRGGSRRTPTRVGDRPGCRSARAVGHADSSARGLRDPGEDVGVQGGDGLQGGRELSRQGRVGHGSDAARHGLALVAGQADGAEADGRVFGAPARERGVVDEPRPADGGAAADRSGLSGKAEQGQRRDPPDHERRRRAARLRPAEDQSRPTCSTPDIWVRWAWT